MAGILADGIGVERVAIVIAVPMLAGAACPSDGQTTPSLRQA
ncbi:MAG: hypothetical protein R2839_00505 [Thermomicrobiales bacterium]